MLSICDNNFFTKLLLMTCGTKRSVQTQKLKGKIQIRGKVNTDLYKN